MTSRVRVGPCHPLLVATLVAASVASAGAQAPPRSASVTALHRLVDSLESAGFSGSVLLANGRDVSLFRSMGVADRSTGRRITTGDRWRWASVSKQITAALVLREVDAGRIGLDVPVASYLPGFREGARAVITVRQLLQHTSGLRNPDASPKDPDGMPRVYRERRADVGDASASRLCDGAPLTTPGSRFEYNNCDYLVLGTLLRARTGKSTTELLADLLGARWTPQDSETVRGYLDDRTAEPAFELATYGSAGAFTGTLESLLAFDRLLMGPLLSSTARAELWQGDPQFGYAALGAWAFEAALEGCADPVRLIERRGEIQGVQVRNVLLPDRDLIVMIFTNRADVQFGEVWQGRGLLHGVLSAAACEKPSR